jgi:hypothetical protein
MATDTFTRLTSIIRNSWLRETRSVGLCPTTLELGGLYLLGDSPVVLHHILSQLGQVDMFIHDSSHTYENMKFEFETSYPYIRSGGLLLSDDTSFNAAFSECAKTLQPAAVRIVRNLGIMKKT